jgi:hypothetical protein
VETSTYEGGLERLERAAIERRGSGDLDALLRSGETWVVEE